MRLVEGQTLDGRYRLIYRLGSGGMADVWRAEDSELGRDVAIKVLHENFARDEEFVERFRREAKAAAGLQHPNVVAVFDRGELEDTYYIAMELVEGASLRDLITRGLSIPEAIEVTRQVLTAAEFAHQKGFVHRDLKPMNVLIDEGGRIRVADFGIAQAGGSEITRTGSVLGTAQYLSPEQAQGHAVIAASDVYSIGVMLFEMLTGRVPFEGENAVAVAMKQVSEPPPAPSSINPAVPPALDAVVLRALAKEPANRYASAAEMLEALNAAEQHPEMVGHTERYAASGALPEEPSRSWWWWIAAAVAALLLVGALVFFLTRASEVAVPGVIGERETVATLRLQQAGFVVDIDRIQSAAEEGTVIEQDPRGGNEAEEGSTVTIDVSLGPAPEAVPDVIGLPQGKARNRLERAGFEVEVNRRFDDTVASNLVIATSPRAGQELVPGETVTIVVSRGTDLVVIPSVVGLDRITAKATLEDAGFTVSEDAQNSDEPEDTVIRQLPSAGESRSAGSRVTIVYSNGIGTVVLPDVVGQTERGAVNDLEKQGLRVSTRTETVETPGEDGVVLEQSPAPGTRLSPGDRVSLVIGEFVPPQPEVP